MAKKSHGMTERWRRQRYKTKLKASTTLMKSSSRNIPIIKVNSLTAEVNLLNLFIKDESKNPFGTFKDRRSEIIVKQALKKKIDTLAIITAGNAGYSLAQYAKGTRLKVICLVDKKLPTLIFNKLLSVCQQVIHVDLSKQIFDSKKIIALVRTSPREIIWDVTNGWEKCYEKIILELRPRKPSYIITPVGSGESFVGLYRGIKKYKLNTTLIGATPRSYPSVADKLHTNWTPYAKKIKSITAKKHKIIHLSEQEIKQACTIARKYVRCEPSSAIVFGAVRKIKLKKTDTVIIINSGVLK
jgi:threonine synthase